MSEKGDGARMLTVTVMNRGLPRQQLPVYGEESEKSS